MVFSQVGSGITVVALVWYDGGVGTLSLRLPDGLHERLRCEALVARRSLNSEIVLRLEGAVGLAERDQRSGDQRERVEEAPSGPPSQRQDGVGRNPASRSASPASNDLAGGFRGPDERGGRGKK